MNQKNIAYWIGTDVRRDLGNTKDYPGPGHYQTLIFKDGPRLS